MAPKLDINIISTVFEQIAGAENAGSGGVFCRAACESIERLARPDCITAENMYSLCYAAGCLAAYRLRLKLSYDAAPSFTAGDVKVGEGATATEAAKALYEEAFAAVSHLMRKNGGILLSVRG